MNQPDILIPISINTLGVFQTTATCTFLKTPTASDTNGLFSEILLSNSNRNGNVTFRCSQVGHAVLFSCHDKVNSSISFSDRSLIQCKKAPVVSVGPKTIRLLKKPTPFIQRLSVSTSEIVSDTNVIVTCLKKGESNVSLSINPVTIYPGTSTGVVSVTIQSISNAQSFTISCTAQSIGGNQYTSVTSEGSSSTILLINGEIVLTPSDVNLYDLQFQVLLYLNGVNQDLGVLCSVSVANNETQADSLINDKTCGMTSTIGATSNTWSVTPYLNEFKASSVTSRTDSLVRLLNVKRNFYPTSEYDNTMEILILKCCSTTQNVTMYPAFANIVTTSRINILLKSGLIINKGEELPTDQTFPYPDPVWTEIAPCPCDLTVNTCDLGCPCDNVCPVNQSTVMSSGFFGGYYNLPNYHSCDNTMLNPTENQANKINLIHRGFTRVPDYHSLLCVVTDNSAVLGKYHRSLSPARNLIDFNRNAQNAKIEYPLDQSSDPSVREVAIDQNNNKQRLYMNGDPLLLLIQPIVLTSSDDPTILVSQFNEYFVLPNDINCDLESNFPIEYLSDRNAYKCPIRLSLIIARLNQFIPSEVIAVYPQATKTSPEDWIFIHRNTPILQSSTGIDNTSTIGASIGFCPNITSTMYLKIFSSVQGKLQGIPLQQIISASIEYSQENWQLICDYTVYPSFCRNSTTLNDAQYFYLSLIVMHSDLSDKAEQLIKEEQLDCELYDTCWNNAFYAWTGLNKLYRLTGKYEQTFEIGVTLGISSLIIIILLITKPFF
ncbi:unnamed protein product [Schistosoma turkestanicum]|nr:unnamed protein product [Schistosoma turkestanicum]